MTPSTEAVWSQLSGDLRAFIRRRVADDHTADDLLQETFVRIHRGLGALTHADRLSAWVYQIARNVVRDHHRTSSVSVSSIDEESTDRADPPRSAAECGGHCGGKWMAELIGKLPENYREPVRLAEIEGLSHQEVADRLRLSLSATKARVQRGRLLLKDLLNQCCVFHVDRRGNVMDVDPRPERDVCLNCDV